MFNWLTPFFSCRNLKKIKAQALKYSLSIVKTLKLNCFKLFTRPGANTKKKKRKEKNSIKFLDSALHQLISNYFIVLVNIEVIHRR